MNYLSTKEVCDLLSVTRDRVSKIARARDWGFIEYRIGNKIAKRYSEEDVNEYLRDRQRTSLLRQTGWLKINGSQLVRDDTYDSTCPVCGAYAVERPPASGADVENIEWLCENGHSHK